MSQTASGKSLHPVLKVALASLDVTLESELERYRAQQPGTSRALPAAVDPPPTHLFLEQTSDVIPPAIAPPAQTVTGQEVAATPDSTSPQPLDQFFDLNDSSAETPHSTRLFTSESATSLATLKVGDSFTSSVRSFNLAEPAESSHFLLPTTPTSPTPNDFLASSEALLQNLAPLTPAQTRHWSQKLLTPWGIAAAVTVVVSLLVAAFNLYQRSEERPISADLSPQNSSVESSTTSPASPSPQAKTTTVPDLSQQEFVDLNLKNLSQVPPTASKPQLATRPASSPRSKLPVKSQRSRPTTRINVPSAPKVEDTSYFYVVTPYLGQTQYSQIQAIVADAFLANFPEGTRVQVGAFDNSRDAQTLVRSLKAQGISAMVRRPSGRR